MTRKVWHPIVACAIASLAVACDGSGSDVRQTGFAADSGVSAALAAFDQKVEWVCGDADLQALFTPTFVGDALVATIKAAIADPQKTDAEFSFVAPIDSFYTDFEDHALCMTIVGDSDSTEASALVSQLRASGSVVSVRRR
jgi:hypothetical protein